MATTADTKVKPALGGDMAWKKALFLGGAVLLLAACSDATAPNSLVRDSKAPASLVMPGRSDLVPTTQSAEPLSMLESCRSGYYVRSGDKDVCVEIVDMP